MPNPQSLEPTYNYLNADIGALSALLGSGLTGENYLTQAQIFNSGTPLHTFTYALDPTKSVFRFGINIPKTVALNGTEEIRIYQNTAQGECNIYNENLLFLTKRLGREDYVSNTELSYISDIRNLSVNAIAQAIIVEISNITPGDNIGFVMAFSRNSFYVDRTTEITDKLFRIEYRLIKGIFNSSTTVNIVTSNNPANLQAAINAAIPLINPENILGISYAIDPAGGPNSHQALITYLP